MSEVHPTAIVDPTAFLDKGVTVGPYAIVGRNAKIGRGTSIGAFAVIGPNTTMGESNRVYPHAVVGEDPQDLKYGGEETELLVGDRNIFREFVTVHRGTGEGGGKTVIGSGNLFMAYCHVAHDCIIGNGVVMANAATLAGHVEVHDHAVIGGLVGVHQFVRIGAHAMVGALSAVAKDIPPFVTAVVTREGKRALFGLNLIGLRRRGFSKETIDVLKKAYRLLQDTSITVPELVRKLKNELESLPEVEYMARFLETSRRGVERT
ncbi:MAG: acyl-ACP--UDP-N-acetylglucosamine O-acyltransferase [Deltaproteobacteria bacterium]|nr:MAG: acyl-ACP--UDP-N-acetylglucosamine O-acyltransferase [Deltaproteobacteria bacterium]